MGYVHLLKFLMKSILNESEVNFVISVTFYQIILGAIQEYIYLKSYQIFKRSYLIIATH